MRIFLVLFFLFTLTPIVHAKDSCAISVSIVCPKSNLKYWKESSILITNNENKVWFLDSKERITLPKGQYKFYLFSEFEDRIDTTITLDTDEKKIILKINWSYIFQTYSNSILPEEGDTIVINYVRKFCSGGVCHQDRDKMILSKTKSGQYYSRYFNPIIIGENCLDATENIWGEKLLKIEKNKIIESYFQSNSVPYYKKRVRECTVQIDRHIYIMNYNTYLKFREELLK